MKDKVIVITGASAGIGAALAELVGREGGRPVLAARREAELQAVGARSGPDALALVVDVTRRAEVERLRDATLERWGRLDVWVNNAGRGITRAVEDLSDEDFDEMMLVNVKSALYGMQAVLPAFRKQGGGHIINVSSMLGRVPFAAMRSAYSASKHALNSLTANLRMDVRDENIQVSLVSPGPVATEFGVRARHGGPDSRRMPAAQTAEEVAAVIADVIRQPRADVYTRAGAEKLVQAYYAAEDMGAAEREPPFLPTRR